MLEMQKVSFAYPGSSKNLYTDFDFSVAPGERVALCAPSGFGKTTLCRLLSGYERPFSGKVLVDGIPLPARGVCPVQLILQHPENAVDPYMRMRAVLAEGGEVNKNILDGLGICQEWMSRYAHELSGGELQRICIARALATHPRYLVADEISVMLDAVSQARIWGFLVKYVEHYRAGLVFVSHSDALVERIATRTIHLV